jgi:lipopolysaccharide export system permease protein
VKTLYRYLFRELLGVTLSTVGVLTALLVLLNVFRDIFSRLQNSDVPLWTIFKLVLLLVPFVLTYTLPWGLLLAVLLVFGRMSHDNELLALKSSGLGLAPLIAPAIWVALFFSAVSFWINAYIGPKCRVAFLQLSYDTVNHNPMTFFVAGVPIDKFEGYRMLIGKKNGNVAENIEIWVLDDNKQTPVRSIRADRALIQPDLGNQRLLLTLTNARQEERGENQPGDVAHIRTGSRAQELPLEISLGGLFKNMHRKFNLRDSTLPEILQHLFVENGGSQLDRFIPMLTEFQSRMALSFSCFTFTLIGIPLAVSVHRRETSIGVVLSLAVCIGYYLIIIVAQALKKNPNVYPELITWLPNLVGQIFGFVMLWRVNKR